MEFNAPRELVFKAFTDPELYVQWIGPRVLETNLETFESKTVVLGDMFKKTLKEMNLHFME